MARAEVTRSFPNRHVRQVSYHGKAVQDEVGDLHWCVALLVGPEPMKIHHVAAGELPEELTIDGQDAVTEAIRWPAEWITPFTNWPTFVH
jgi:hypothetical protein